MREWQIALPDKSDLLLKSLKSLALFEFLPTDKINDHVFDWLGIKEENSDCKTEEDAQDNEECPKSTVDQLAVVLLGVFAIIFLILLLIILGILACFCPKVKQCFLNLKKKLFYGSIIRYLLLSSLKT